MQQHRLTYKGEPVFVISWHFISDDNHHINSPVNPDLTTAGILSSWRSLRPPLSQRLFFRES